MRSASLFALGVLLLSGCTALPEEPTVDSLFGLCPQWTPGGATQQAVEVPPHDDFTVRLDAPNGLTLQRLPLDQVVLRAENLTGSLAVRHYRDLNGTRGEQANLRSHQGTQPTFVPVLPLAAGAREFDLFLAPTTGTARPGPVWLSFTNEGDRAASFTLHAAFHYRVCSA
ncbi:MAG: hypothetical protein AABX89_03980 [Candidatus Thermoplasmatota archaeon]